MVQYGAAQDVGEADTSSSSPLRGGNSDRQHNERGATIGGYDGIKVVNSSDDNDSRSWGEGSYQNSPLQYDFPTKESSTSTLEACREWSPRCPFACFSSIIFVMLMVISGNGDEWTLHAGETRQVETTALLNSNVIFDDSNQSSTSVYSFKGACPPLTGPTLTIAGTKNIMTKAGDYQYEYFYLNAGSLLDVTVRQEAGATNIHIVRGLAAVEDRMGKPDEEHASFEGEMLERHAKVGTTQHVQYKVRDANTYVVIYDNASKSGGTRSKATVSYNATLTTYNLEAIEAANECADQSTSCQIDASRDCILLKASKETTVHISTTRRWGLLLFVSSIPILIGLWCMTQRRRGKSSWCCLGRYAEYILAQTSDEFYYAAAGKTQEEASSSSTAIKRATMVNERITSILESEFIPFAVAIPEEPSADDKV